MKNECYCPKCDWGGLMRDAISKHFGAYCGSRHTDNWGWEEWDDLVCPDCETVLEYIIDDDDDDYLFIKNTDGSVSLR